MSKLNGDMTKLDWDPSNLVSAWAEMLFKLIVQTDCSVSPKLTLKKSGTKSVCVSVYIIIILEINSHKRKNGHIFHINLLIVKVNEIWIIKTNWYGELCTWVIYFFCHTYILNYVYTILVLKIVNTNKII